MRKRYPRTNRYSARHVRWRHLTNTDLYFPLSLSWREQKANSIHFQSWRVCDKGVINLWFKFHVSKNYFTKKVTFVRKLPSTSKNTNICTMWYICHTAYRVVFSCKETSFSEQTWEYQDERRSSFSSIPSVFPRPSTLSPHCPSSGGPAWPSLDQQENARERERGWNVLKVETFLIVHSHRLYVTQTDHVTQLCSSRGKPKHYLRHSGFLALIWLCKPHTYTTHRRTDWLKRLWDQQTDQQTERDEKD